MRLFGMFETRDHIESPAVPITSSSLLDFVGGATSDAGVRVSEVTAFGIPAVWRAVSVISNVSASLPLHAFRLGTRDRVSIPLLENPHPELTPFELWRLSYTHRSLWGNSYFQKIRNGGGQIVQLWPIRPDRVQVERFPPSDGIPGGKLFQVTDDWGKTHVFTSADILHIPGIGYDGVTGVSPIRIASEGFGLAIAAEKSAAKLFGNGNMVSGILQTEQRLDSEQAEQLKLRWKSKVSGVGNAHDVAVLDSGASFQPVTMPFKDSQFLESRQFQVSEIARIFGVPQFLLMDSEKSTSWGTGLEQQAQGFVTFDLGPTWLTPTEQRITKELLPRTQYAKYNVSGLLRGDSEARSRFYQSQWQLGALSSNEIRELEDMPPVTGGDSYYVPLNFAPRADNGMVEIPAADEATPEEETITEEISDGS